MSSSSFYAVSMHCCPGLTFTLLLPHMKRRLKAAHKPYQLPDPSGLRLTRLQYDVDKYLSALRESAIRVSAFDMEWSQYHGCTVRQQTELAEQLSSSCQTCLSKAASSVVQV